MSIRIAIADDHTLFRSGLRALLEADDELSVVAEAGDGGEAVDVVREHEPDVLILDVSMPGKGGSAAARAALRAQPELAIVVLTMHEDVCYLREFFALGARAFVLKKSCQDVLISAIWAAKRGERYIDPVLSGQAMSLFVGKQTGRKKALASVLTPREKEVCELLALGHTNHDIGEKLFISERTVESHRNHIMTKLGFKTRAKLVRFAIDNGILRLT